MASASWEDGGNESATLKNPERKEEHMSVYVWVKHELEDEVRALAVKKEFGDLLFYPGSGSEGPKLVLHASPFDPTLDVPDIPEMFVEKVSFHTQIWHNFWLDGLYEENGVKLLARVEGWKGYYTLCQQVNVYGPSIAAVKEMYARFVTRKIEPKIRLSA